MYQTERNNKGEFVDNYKGNAMENNIVEAIRKLRKINERNKFKDNLKVERKCDNNYYLLNSYKDTKKKEKEDKKEREIYDE